MGLLNSLLRRNASVISTAATTHTIPESGTSVQKKIHEDPFTKECIKNVHLYYSKPWSSDPLICKGSIEFQQGNTSGKQHFDGPSIEAVLEEMAEFVKTL